MSTLLVRTIGLCCLATLPLSLEAFEVRLQGLDGALKENVQAQLSSVDHSNISSTRLYRAQVNDAIRTALEALGHYEPKIEYRWRNKGKDAILEVNVEPDEIVRLAATNVTILGNGKSDSAFTNFLEQRPNLGEGLNQGQYEDFKSGLQSISAQRGYFDAEFVKKQLGVNVTEHKAYWDLIYDTGERYRFGGVQFLDSQIRPAILQNIVPFKEGDYYDAAALAQLNERLSKTQWFQSILLTPDIEAGREDSEKNVPIVAMLTPRKGNAVETGLGYSTNVGPRGKVKWTKPWLNDRGHSLEIGSEVSRYEQTLDSTYKLPLMDSPLEHYYLFQGGYKRKSLNDTESDAATLMASRYWEPYDGWLKAFHLTWKLDSFTQGQQSQNSMLLYPGATLSKTRSRGGLMPRWGDSQRYTLQWSDSLWGSDADFVALEMQHTLIRTFAERHRFVLRSHAGWIETNDFKNVPPDLRYFAGGDRSLRGYDYESISPRDENGDLTGATKLFTGSVEYQFKVTGKWWAAAFMDFGDAVDHWQDFKVKKGAGLGVRWESPLGPIKLDIARPVGSGAPNSWQFYIGLGPEL